MNLKGYHAATMIGKQIQADLEAMIRAELMKHAEKIVDEVAREIAKNIDGLEKREF